MKTLSKMQQKIKFITLWHLAAIVFAGLIVYLAVLSVRASGSVFIFIKEGNVKTSYSIEALYRAVFNPLWVVVLFCYSKGRQKHIDFNQNVVNGLNILLDTYDKKSIPKEKIKKVLDDVDDVAERVEERFADTDSVSNENSSPKI